LLAALPCREQLIAKKAFHHLKTIRKVRWPHCAACQNSRQGVAREYACLTALQEIKKAKEFEVRKILRRIKQAQEQHSKAEGGLAGLTALNLHLPA
jgi:hypothetical protein